MKLNINGVGSIFQSFYAMIQRTKGYPIGSIEISMLIENGIELQELETVYHQTLTSDIQHVYPSLKKLTILDCSDCMYVTVNKVLSLIHSSDNKEKKINIHHLPLPN